MFVFQYVRLCEDDDLDHVVTLLRDHWKLPIPDLIISVTGGAQDFIIKKELLRQFQHGLVKAANVTKAWIITGGTSSGVMKHVGKAVNEFATAYGDEKHIVIIGIATWKKIRGNFNPGEKEDNVETSHSDKVTLDEHHTHFFLVDSTQNKYQQEIEFRSQFESRVSEKYGNSKIPIVSIVLEGGVGTLKTCLSAIKKNTPCVIIANSGRAANLLEKIYKKTISR